MEIPTEFSVDNPPRIGEIVQANQKAAHWFRCLIVVDEVKTWGIQGFTTIPSANSDPPGDAFIRLQWDEIEPTGGATRFITEEMRDAIQAETEAGKSAGIVVGPEGSDDEIRRDGNGTPPAKPA
jgi:hypothetical protein